MFIVKHNTVIHLEDDCFELVCESYEDACDTAFELNQIELEEAA